MFQWRKYSPKRGFWVGHPVISFRQMSKAQNFSQPHHDLGNLMRRSLTRRRGHWNFFRSQSLLVQHLSLARWWGSTSSAEVLRVLDKMQTRGTRRWGIRTTRCPVWQRLKPNADSSMLPCFFNHLEVRDVHKIIPLMLNMYAGQTLSTCWACAYKQVDIHRQKSSGGLSDAHCGSFPEVSQTQWHRKGLSCCFAPSLGHLSPSTWGEEHHFPRAYR